MTIKPSSSLTLQDKNRLITRTFFLYLLTFIFFQAAMSSVFSIYYSDSGIIDSNISSIKAWQNIGILIGLIPAGYLADKFGCLKTLSISSIVIALGFSFILCFQDIFWFSLAEFIYGLGLALNSGIVLVYINKLQEEFGVKIDSKIMGQRTSLLNITVLLSGNIGSFLYKSDMSYPLAFSIIGLLLYPCILLYWSKLNNLKDYKAHSQDVKLTFFNKHFFKVKEMKYLLLLNSLIEGAVQFVLIYWSIYFVNQLHYDLSVVYNISVIGKILGGQLYFNTINISKPYKAVIIYLLVSSCSIFLVPSFENFVVLVLFGAFQVGYGATESSLQNLKNNVLFRYANKAQTMSTLLFLSEIIITLILFANKNIIELIPLHYMFWISGLIMSLSIPVMWKLRHVTCRAKEGHQNVSS